MARRTLMRVTIHGDKQLLRQLRVMEARAQGEALAASVEAGAAVMRDNIKDNAPVRSGDLRDSIEVEPE
jgi:hypothetical protein